jgi:hypothetical protein
MKKTLAFALLLLAGCTGLQKTTDTQTDPANDSIMTADPTSGTTLLDDDAPDTTAMFSPDNFVIIPGKQVGNITAGSTEAQLADMLGKDIVKADTIYDAEGNPAPGTSLFADTPDQVLILWKDTLKRARPEFVMVRPSAEKPGTAGMQTQWIVPNGPTIGSTLKEVEKFNGRPFVMSGFGWDYGGQLTDAKGGTLGGNGQRSYLTLQFSYGPSAKAQKLAEKVMGDSEFSSANPVLQQLNPRVSELGISFKK